MKSKLFFLIFTLIIDVSLVFADSIKTHDWYEYIDSLFGVMHTPESFMRIPQRIGDLNYFLNAESMTASVGSMSFKYPFTSAFIPETVEYDSVVYRVTSIEEGVFWGCTNLTSVNIPASVKDIHIDAFAGCVNLKEINVAKNNKNYRSKNGVLFNKDLTTLMQYPNGKQGVYTIPSSVKNIEKYAFRYCSGLTSVTIPKSVTNISIGAFRYCFDLKEINVAEDNKNYSSIDGVLFNKDLTTLVQYPDGRQGDYTIPDNVINIEEYAFRNCYFLMSLEDFCHYNDTIPDCTGLANLTIPSSVTNIGDRGFYLCSCATSITCKAITPPTFRGYRGTPKDRNIVLYVPAVSIDAYKTADGWKYFTNIQAIQQSSEITITDAKAKSVEIE